MRGRRVIPVVRTSSLHAAGDCEGWIRFFLESVATIAAEAVRSARELSALVREDRRRVLAVQGSLLAAARLFEWLPSHPILTINRPMQIIETTRPTASKAVSSLVEAGVLDETTGRKRDRRVAYRSYLKVLGEGTELEG